MQKDVPCLLRLCIQKMPDLMKLALDDRLHQPYRSRLVPGFDEIINELKEVDSVIGTVLSGAGPSILVISTNNNEEIKAIVKSVWESLGVKADIRTVDVETKGAFIL